MGGKIDCYIDIASFFSYVAFADLLPKLPLLAAHGIQVEFHPTLIAGINNLSGNKPPWLLPAKAKYLAIDSRRAATRAGKPNARFPPHSDFMNMSLTTSPLRALHVVKANYPEAVFLAVFATLFDRFYTPPHVNPTVDKELEAVLLTVTLDPKDPAAKPVFSTEDVRRIMDGRAEAKDALKQATSKAVELGAFGAPWIWATNANGKGQPFFGSDRFNHVYQYLGIPFQDVEILPPAKL
jgi:glutathione S-transferase kappa 1